MSEHEERRVWRRPKLRMIQNDVMDDATRKRMWAGLQEQTKFALEHPDQFSEREIALHQKIDILLDEIARLGERGGPAQ